MGKGPGTIYKDCLAQAIQTDRILADKHAENDIQAQFNVKIGFASMFEIDVKRVFFEQNYSEKTTERAIRQWAELDLISRVSFKKYQFIAFWGYPSNIREAK